MTSERKSIPGNCCPSRSFRNPAAGRALDRDEIMQALRGIDSECFNRVVDITMSRLRQKLKPLELIKTVRGQGYVFVGQDS